MMATIFILLTVIIVFGVYEMLHGLDNEMYGKASSYITVGRMNGKIIKKNIKTKKKEPIDEKKEKLKKWANENIEYINSVFRIPSSKEIVFLKGTYPVDIKEKIISWMLLLERTIDCQELNGNLIFSLKQGKPFDMDEE